MNQQEYQALENEYLTHEARALYVMCLRRHMDYETGLVGTAKRRISFQQFSEQLSVSRPRGSTLKPFRPSTQNIRGYIKELINAGLVEAMPKQRKRDCIVFRLPLATTDSNQSDLFRLNEEQQRSNKSQQHKEQQKQQHKEQPYQQHKQSQKIQGFQTEEQQYQQQEEQQYEQPLQQHGSNKEQQHTSVTSVNTHTHTRAHENVDVQAFDERFPPQANIESIDVGRKFPMRNDWQPDDSLTDQAQLLGVDLSNLDQDQGEVIQQALEEFRTFWQEDRPGYTTTQRLWQQKFIQSLKKFSGPLSGQKGERYGQRRSTHQQGRTGSPTSRAFTSEDFDLDATW